MGKDRVSKLGSNKLLVPTKDSKGVVEVDLSKLTSEQRNIIVDQVLEVVSFPWVLASQELEYGD